MGALTSKIHAFKNRPWEFHQFKSVDFFDILGLLIYVDVFGNKIVRLLIENSVNYFWLTDKVRFFFDSQFNNRLYYPFINYYFFKKLNNLLFCISWKDIYDYFLSLKSLLKFILIKTNYLLFYNLFFKNNMLKIFNFNFKYINFVNFFVNENFDYINAKSLKYFNRFLNLKINYNFIFNNFNLDFLNDYFIINNLKNYEQIFLLYCNLRSELPNLYFYFLKNLKLKKIKNIYTFGYNIKINLNFINFGLNEKFFFFKSYLLKKYNLNYLKFKNTLIIFGILFSQRYDFYSLFNLYKNFFFFFKKKDFLLLNQNLVFYSLILINLDFINNFNNLFKLRQFDLFFFINDININLLNLKKIKIQNNFFFSHHIPEDFNLFDIFFPIPFIYEKNNIYLNVFNKYCYSDFLITPESINLFLLNEIIYLIFFSFYNIKYFVNFFFFNLLSNLNFYLKNLSLINYLDKLFNKYLVILLMIIYIKKNLINVLYLIKISKSLKVFNLIIEFIFFNIKIYSFFFFKHLNFIYNFFCFDIISKNSLYLNLKKN